MLLPFIARSDTERRVVINTIGPVWEGNQVWLILSGGAIFAAWPALYAASFSGFYFAMLLVLAALVLRPVGFKFRSKMPGPRWRATWDWVLFVGGLVPALVFGVAMGNLIEGVPFGLFDLLNPYALLCGLVSVSMLLTHGAAYLAVKTEGVVAERARALSRLTALSWLVLFALGGAWLWRSGYGLAIVSGAIRGAAPDPLAKTAVHSTGAWLANFGRWPASTLVPAIGLLAPALVAALAGSRRRLLVFSISSLGIAAVIGTLGVSLFPFLLPSLSDPGSSLTVWDASSSRRTLGIMLIAVVVVLPVVIAYTAWVYHVLRGPVTNTYIESNRETIY
jgi:cytochrome d ubiquinol oxidase subunit II